MKNNPYRVDQYYKYSLQESHELNKAHKELLFGKFLDQRSEFVYLGIIQLIQRNIGTPYMPFDECAVTVRQLAREQLEAGIRDVFELPGRTRAILNQRHFRRP